LPFTKPVSGCERPDFGQHSCDPSKLVGARELVEEAIPIIDRELTHQSPSSGAYRVRPMLCSRMARGGKTTLLFLIFDKLKQLNLSPIFISFNGSSNFQQREGETHTQAIVRSIALQLVETTGYDPRYLVCEEQALDDYLGEKPVVLIIDELNALGFPIDQDAGRMLRKLFLDKNNRYLIYSSHITMDIGDKNFSKYVASSANSERGFHVLNFKPCIDLALFRQMSPACGSISPAQVMLFGGIPSLIYSVRNGEMTPEERFLRTMQQPIVKKTLRQNPNELFQTFVRVVLSGIWNKELSIFEEFGMTKEQNKFIWPLCYIEHILKTFDRHDAGRNFILDNIQSLWGSASTVGSGKDWECLINIALAFQCLRYSYDGGSFGPFGDIPQFDPDREKDLELIFCHLPGELENLSTAMDYLHSLQRLTPEKNVLILAVPCSSKFETFDGLLIRQKPQQVAVICGYQAKLGKGTPINSLPEDCAYVLKGYLLRGRPVQQSTETRGWNFLGYADLRDLLGYSFMEFAPANWPTSQAPGGLSELMELESSQRVTEG
jgi:hypothetical protein